MAQSLIRWKRSDYAKLGKAVANFNRQIDKVKNGENLDYLPEKFNYKDVKANILTRQELNRKINELKRFSRKGASDLYLTQSNMKMTKWEYNELKINERVAKAKLTREINAFNNEPLKLESNYTRAQMGSQKLEEMKATRKNLGNLENLTGKAFERLKARLRNYGSSDFSMKRAIIYRENYIKTMKKYKNFRHYDKLDKKMQELSNPEQFYDFMSANELTKDLTYQSDQVYGEEEFDNYLYDLGVINDDELEEYEEEYKKYKYKLISKEDNHIIAESNDYKELLNYVKKSKDKEIKNAIIFMNND